MQGIIYLLFGKKLSVLKQPFFLRSTNTLFGKIYVIKIYITEFK